MGNAKRTKAKAAVYVPQSREDCIADIKKLGDVQRDLVREQADMNDAIATVTKRHAERLESLTARIAVLSQGVQTWAEAHRSELTQEGKVKTANLITGEVSWRNRPPSCGVRGAEAVIETLKKLGLGRFVRSKEEIDKEAILKTPDDVRGIAGIIIVTGVEDFVITPFEQEAAT